MLLPKVYSKPNHDRASLKNNVICWVPTLSPERKSTNGAIEITENIFAKESSINRETYVILNDIFTLA